MFLFSYTVRDEEQVKINYFYMIYFRIEKEHFYNIVIVGTCHFLVCIPSRRLFPKRLIWRNMTVWNWLHSLLFTMRVILDIIPKILLYHERAWKYHFYFHFIRMKFGLDTDLKNFFWLVPWWKNIWCLWHVFLKFLLRVWRW
jgi:hypothetical protein